jgi:hypothetical protein
VLPPPFAILVVFWPSKPVAARHERRRLFGTCPTAQQE